MPISATPYMTCHFAEGQLSVYSLYYMRFVRSGRRPLQSLVVVIGIVCVALVLLTGVLQVTHSHPDGQTEHDCSLCVTAHQAVQIAIVVTVFVTSRPVFHFTRERFAPLPRQRFVLKLANRPPPAEPAFA